MPSTSAKPTASAGQLERHRQPLEDELDDGLAGAPRGAEIAVGEPAEPRPYCDVPRLVEAEEALAARPTMAGLTTASAPIICSTTVPGIRRSIRKTSTVSPASVTAIEYSRTTR